MGAQWVVMLLSTFLLLSSSSRGLAQSYGSDFDEEPWVEQQSKLPLFPRSENLARISMDTLAGFDVSIDLSTVDIGADKIVRYVLVARSSRGSENITFEGLRCESRERKLYAIGKSDKTWGQVHSSSWSLYGANDRSYHHELAREFFCPDLKTVSSVAEALKNITQGGYRRNRHSGFPE